MKTHRTLAWLNALAFLVHFTLSQMSALNLIGGATIGQISDKYSSYFTPAGLTFSIWGIIYLGLFALIIYHLVQAYKKPEEAEPNRHLLQMGSLFIVNNLATAAWVVCWQYEYIGVAAALLVLQFLTLLIIHLRLFIYLQNTTLASKLCTQIPLSLYFGWISVAMIANLSSALRAYGFSGWGLSEAQWVGVLIVALTLVATFMVLLRRNVAYGLVVVWALFGISRAHEQNIRPDSELVVQWCYIGLAFVSVVVAVQLFRNFRLNLPQQTRTASRF